MNESEIRESAIRWGSIVPSIEEIRILNKHFHGGTSLAILLRDSQYSVFRDQKIFKEKEKILEPGYLWTTEESEQRRGLRETLRAEIPRQSTSHPLELHLLTPEDLERLRQNHCEDCRTFVQTFEEGKIVYTRNQILS